MFITGTWQRGARCFLIAITDPPGFCSSACTLPTAQGQGQKDQLFFWSPYPIVRPSVQLYSLDLINSELFRWGGPLTCRLLFFSLRICQKPCTEGGFKRLWFFFMNNEKGSPCPDKKRVSELSDTVRTLVWLSWPFFTKVIFKMNIKCSFSWLIMMRKWHIVSTAITFFSDSA